LASRSGQEEGDWNSKLRDLRWVKADKYVSIASGENPVCGTLRSVRLTRSRRSCGIAGNGTLHNQSDSIHGADPPKKVSGNTGGAGGV
jgi:hypothetical protein